MTSEKQKTGVRLQKVTDKRDGQRLDNYLLAQLPGVPRSVIYKIVRTGQVRINGKRCKPFQKIHLGDEIRIPPVHVQDRGSSHVPDGLVKALEAAVVFENEELLVCNKPSGVAVHGGSGINWGLIEAFRQSRPQQDLDLVHRIDRETSGVLVLAKGFAPLKHLQGQFARRETEKRYLALLHGRLPGDFWTVDQPLLKREISGERFMVVDPAGKSAVTHFRRLEDYGDSTLVEVTPVTGRTHQIRAHAVFLGAPLAGDSRYLDDKAVAQWRRRGLKRLFLHAHALELQGLSGEMHHFSAPLPDELNALLHA